MDDFELELKNGFLDEATQGIEEVEQCFLSLEANPNDSAIIDKIFRLAHNLKGSSKAVGFNQLGEFTHVFENLLLKIKKNEVTVSSQMVSLLLRCNDHLKYFIVELRANFSANVDSVGLLGEMESAINGGLNETTVSLSAEPVVESTAQPAVPVDLEYNQSLGVSAPQNTPDASLFEEPAPVVKAPIAKSVTPAAPKPETPVADENIRVSLAKLEKLINYVGEMVILQSVLREQSALSSSHLLKKSVHQMGRVSKEIQDLSMGLRMLPIKPIFQKMQRIVRDTSAALDKKVSFHIEGEETAVDKTVLDLIGDPLVHLVRNAVDHGIEVNEKRKTSGKSMTGNVSLKAFHRGDQLVLEVQDDGGGIDPEVLARKAIEKGVIPENHNLSRTEKINLVFHAGFSTKAQTTEISGRGVGMDVVRTNIEAMQGSIEIDTEVGKGSIFRIMLPLTLAIVDGMVLESSGEFYVVPLSLVRDAVKPQKDQVQFNKGMGETLLRRGENLPLYRLDYLLKRNIKPKPIDKCIVIVVKGAQTDFGIVIDDIVNQQQVVIKKLGVELQGIKGFSGSAILGSGRPALILEPSELVSNFLIKNPVIDLSILESA